MQQLKWMDADHTILQVEIAPNHYRIVEAGNPDWPALSQRDDIAPYAPPTPEEILAAERAAMVCTRAQGKLAIGPEVWAQVVAMADEPDTPWGLKVAIYDTYEWRRLDPNMDVLIWAMQLTPEEADDLFRLAMTL